MRGAPHKIVKVDGKRWTRDGRYRIRVHFGMYFAAWKPCVCKPFCYCQPVELPGGIAGTGFDSVPAIQRALEEHYRRRGWTKETSPCS